MLETLKNVCSDNSNPQYAIMIIFPLLMCPVLGSLCSTDEDCFEKVQVVL